MGERLEHSNIWSETSLFVIQLVARSLFLYSPLPAPRPPLTPGSPLAHLWLTPARAPAPPHPWLTPAVPCRRSAVRAQMFPDEDPQPRYLVGTGNQIYYCCNISNNTGSDNNIICTP